MGPRNRAAGALRSHWPEYLIEGALLGLFMVSACVFGTLLEAPASPAHAAIGDPIARRALMALAMGATAMALIYSPWGKRSGAHMNPALTATFWRLGKTASWDAVFYAIAQTVGSIAGVLLSWSLLGPSLAQPPVSYVATVPGPEGVTVAFVAEVAITFVLMLVVLASASHARWMSWTGVLAGVLLAAYIMFESPISGTSMNPARSLASALPAGRFQDLWIYFLGPPLGMLAAAESFVRLSGARAAYCAKLCHEGGRPCIFCGGGTPLQA